MTQARAAAANASGYNPFIALSSALRSARPRIAFYVNRQERRRTERSPVAAAGHYGAAGAGRPRRPDCGVELSGSTNETTTFVSGGDVRFSVRQAFVPPVVRNVPGGTDGGCSPLGLAAGLLAAHETKPPRSNLEHLTMQLRGDILT